MNSRHKQVKKMEYILIAIALILLITGFVLTMVGSSSFANYYVDKIDINNFYESVSEFFNITIQYSGVFYLGFLFIIMSVLFFLLALMAFVVDYEFYTKKQKELGLILTKINPQKIKVPSVEVGAKYVYEKDKNQKVD